MSGNINFVEDKKSLNRGFYNKVFLLVVPMALQNLINVGVSACDVLMLGKVSETVLSGASLGSQIQYILNLIYFGLTSGSAVLTAQYWGKRDIKTIEKVMGMALAIGVAAGMLFTVVTFLFPEQLMRIFTKDPEVIGEGAKYLRIVCFTYLLTAITMVYLNVMRSVERVMISTIVYLISFLTNLVVNAVLIFGLLGVEPMGIRGAAFGTLAARIVEIILVALYARFYNREVKVRLHYIFHFNRELLQDFLKYSIPVTVNEMMWGLGCSANAAIIGHLGKSAVSANSVAQVVRQLATVIVFGLAGAASIMIGKAIGENKEALAEWYAAKLLRLTWVFGLVSLTGILLGSHFIVHSFSMSSETDAYMTFFLVIMAFFVAAQASNTTCVVGIFRAGGDTRFGLALDVSTMWCGSIFMGALAAFVLHLDVKIIYIILLSDEFIKIPICLWRYKSKKWLNHVTRE